MVRPTSKAAYLELNDSGTANSLIRASWSIILTRNDHAVVREDKNRLRKELAEQIDEYLSAGKEITEVPTGVSGEKRIQGPVRGRGYS